MNLTARQHYLLKEAQRRYRAFYQDVSLTEAWTGLGTYTAYKPVLKAGLMEWIRGKPPPRVSGWLRLTEAGAVIVLGWMNEAKTRQRSFPVTSICREDVDYALGLDEPGEYTDEEMRLIAQKMNELVGRHDRYDMLAQAARWVAPTYMEVNNDH